MTTLIKKPRSLFITLVFIVITCTSTFGAHAGLMYNGYADIEFNLDNVAVVGGSGNGNGNGNGPNANSYLVTPSGSLFDFDVFTSGAGFAAIETNFFPSVDLLAGTSVFQTSESYGDSNGTGEASSYADTIFSLVFQNNHQNQLRFDLLFTAFLSAEITNIGPLILGNDAGAFSQLSFSAGGRTIYDSYVEAFVGGSILNTDLTTQSLSFTVDPGASYTISGIASSDGYAVTVPEPSMFWLMALGLISMLVKNHKRSNTRIKNRN